MSNPSLEQEGNSRVQFEHSDHSGKPDSLLGQNPLVRRLKRPAYLISTGITFLGLLTMSWGDGRTNIAYAANPTPFAQKVRSLDTQPECDVQKVSVFDNNKFDVLAKCVDGTHMWQGEFDGSAGQVTAKDRGILGEYPVDIARVTASKLVVVGADKRPTAEGISKGKIWVIDTSAKTIKTYDHPGTVVGSVRPLTPDSAIIGWSTGDAEVSTKWDAFDVSTGTYTAFSCSGDGCSASAMNAFSNLNGTITSYGSDVFRDGYVEQRINLAQKTLTTTLYHPEDGYLRPIIQATNGITSTILAINNTAAKYPGTGFMMEYQNNSKVGGDYVPISRQWPARSVYQAVPDVDKNIAYVQSMEFGNGLTTMTYADQVSLQDIGDSSKRKQVPNNGDYFEQIENNTIGPRSLNFLKDKGKTVLMTALSRYHFVYDSATQNSNAVLNKGGILFRDSTNDKENYVDLTKSWKRVQVIKDWIVVTYQNFLPLVFRLYRGGW